MSGNFVFVFSRLPIGFTPINTSYRSQCVSVLLSFESTVRSYDFRDMNDISKLPSCTFMAKYNSKSTMIS